jgi:hypothetical protein
MTQIRHVAEIYPRNIVERPIADIIETDQLGPQAIARLFAMSVSPNAGRVAAVVILAVARV